MCVFLCVCLCTYLSYTVYTLLFLITPIIVPPFQISPLGYFLLVGYWQLRKKDVAKARNIYWSICRGQEFSGGKKEINQFPTATISNHQIFSRDAKYYNSEFFLDNAKSKKLNRNVQKYICVFPISHQVDPLNTSATGDPVKQSTRVDLEAEKDLVSSN